MLLAFVQNGLKLTSLFCEQTRLMSARSASLSLSQTALNSAGGRMFFRDESVKNGSVFGPVRYWPGSVSGLVLLVVVLS